MLKVFTQVFLTFIYVTFTEAQEKSIIETLKGVPQFSSLTDSLSRFPGFASLLEKQNVTLLAPNNEAFTASLNLTEALWSYHIIDGTYSTFATDWTQYLPTHLHETAEDGNNLVVAQTSPFSNITTFWSGLQKESYTTGSVTKCSNGVIHTIESFLELPKSFSLTWLRSSKIGPSPFVAGEIIGSGLSGATAIDDLSNVTIFLPISYAFMEIGSIVNGWTIDDLQRILSYHIVDKVITPGSDGTLRLGKYSTLDGMELLISDYEGLQFINNARIVNDYNWIFRGGTIYTIFGQVREIRRADVFV